MVKAAGLQVWNESAFAGASFSLPHATLPKSESRKRPLEFPALSWRQQRDSFQPVTASVHALLEAGEQRRDFKDVIK